MANRDNHKTSTESRIDGGFATKSHIDAGATRESHGGADATRESHGGGDAIQGSRDNDGTTSESHGDNDTTQKSRKGLVMVLIILALVIIMFPLFKLRGAEFSGSDDAGSEMVEEIVGKYEPWFEPILETIIGGELPGEVESLFFCIQTGIGVGVIAYCFGYLVARKKYGGEAL